MWSSSATLARPVRSAASSLRKSSTAFSMRVLACAIASLLLPIAVMGFFPPGVEVQEISRCYRFIRRRAGLSAPRHAGADPLAVHHALDISMHVQVEHDDGHVVVHAKRTGRRVHDLQTLLQYIAKADTLDAFRPRHFFGVGVVDAVHAGGLQDHLRFDL